MTPSLIHKEGGQGVNLTSFLDLLYMVSYYLPTYSKPLQATIKAKNSKSVILLPQFDPQEEGQGVNLSIFLDSQHIVSYYLSINSKALNATDKEIMGGEVVVKLSFLVKLFGYINANKSLNFGSVASKI